MYISRPDRGFDVNAGDGNELPNFTFNVLDTETTENFPGDFHDIDHDGPEDDRLDRELK